MPRKKPPESTFRITLKPAAEVVSGARRVFLEISQPACFGQATLVLGAEDIDGWERVLKQARELLEET